MFISFYLAALAVPSFILCVYYITKKLICQSLSKIFLYFFLRSCVSNPLTHVKCITFDMYIRGLLTFKLNVCGGCYLYRCGGIFPSCVPCIRTLTAKYKPCGIGNFPLNSMVIFARWAVRSTPNRNEVGVSITPDFCDK